MALHLSTARVRRVAEAARVLAAPHEFGDLAAWGAEVVRAARAALGSDAAIAQLPGGDANGGAARMACDGVDAAIAARCERMFRLGPARSDDPATRDARGILDACVATGQRTWTGPSFIARATPVLGDPAAVRRSAFVHEIIAPAGLWRGPHLHARVAGEDAVLGLSPPHPAARLGEDDALLVAELLQPAWAAGARAARARWGGGAPPSPAAPSGAALGSDALGGDAFGGGAFGGSGARLTPREREVAALLAARRTNAEVAAALGVSGHTARHHVERVLGKLGVRSRRAVAASWPAAAPAAAGGGEIRHARTA